MLKWQQAETDDGEVNPADEKRLWLYATVAHQTLVNNTADIARIEFHWLHAKGLHLK